MGSTSSKDKGSSGIKDYQLFSLIGYITQTFEDVLSGHRSYDEGKNVIIFHLKELSRYSLNKLKSPNPDNVYFNGQPQLLINEKYRHVDGEHAWSLTLHFNQNLRMIKLLHGTPVSRNQINRTDDPAKTIGHPIHDDTTRQISNTTRTSPDLTRPSLDQTRSQRIDRSDRTESIPRIQNVPKERPTRTMTSAITSNGQTSHNMRNINTLNKPISGLNERKMPLIENDQITQNMGDFGLGRNVLDDMSGHGNYGVPNTGINDPHVPQLGVEEFNLSKF